jgi:hypothetical protein
MFFLDACAKKRAMKKRNGKRINQSLLVDLDHNGTEQMGVTINISRRGMCIATMDTFPPLSELNIWIAAADEIFKLQGQVVWNMKKESALEESIPVGLGIRLATSGPEYARFIKFLKRKKASRRAAASAAAGKILN